MEEEKDISADQLSSFQQLRRLKEGSLDAHAARQLTEQAAEDPLLADAIEGLEEVPDTHTMELAVSRIRGQARSRIAGARVAQREKLTKRKSRVHAQPYMNYLLVAAAAASILWVSVYILRQAQAPAPALTEQIATAESPGDPQVLGNTATLPATSPSLSAPEMQQEDPSAARQVETLPPADPEKSIRALPPTREQEATRRTEDVSSQTPDIVISSPAAAAPVTSATKPAPSLHQEAETYEGVLPELSYDDASNSSRETDQTKKLEKQTYSEKKQADVLSIPAMSDDERRRGELLKTQGITDLLTEALALYEKKDYAASKDKFEEVLIGVPEHVVATYYVGHITYLQGQYAQAIPLLRKTIGLTETRWQEEARWDLARSYAALGRKSSARKLLMEIVVNGGKYALEAQAMLDAQK
ncbi:MAG: hypothetical protein EAZ89_11115 [Bacteroidetes bacterium]|nr:MAG: hypothetical protein EAZ89_11115 [Bacteroidota bacterium]